jgi:hypothetical protein
MSTHSTIGVGDAENDHSLLVACELGVAVANAVDGLKRDADAVTNRPCGEGVVELLRGPLLSGEQRIHPARWQLLVGTDEHGDPVTIPSSQINVLINGCTGAGKSYAAGMLAEQLMSLGYSLLVVDPEGDFEQLGSRPGVVVTGGPHPIADPDDIVSMLHRENGSVVVNLSGRPNAEIDSLYHVLPPLLEVSRAATGTPHWIVVDEAHGALGRHAPATRFLAPDHVGYLLVTYRPDDLDDAARNRIDVELVMADQELGHASVRQRGVAGHREIRLASRTTPHRRHWHKYATTVLPRQRGFWFRSDEAHLTGEVATSISEFHHEISCADPRVLHHHAASGDFSRWIDGVFRDHELAKKIRATEQAIDDACDAPALEAARQRLLTCLERTLFG